MGIKEDSSSAEPFSNLWRSLTEPMVAFRTTPWTASLMVLVLLFFVGQAFTVVQVQNLFFKSSAPGSLDISNKQFESCDKNYRIRFSEHNNCTIHKRGSIVNGTYVYLPIGQLDLSTLIHGYLKRNEVWYRCDLDGLLDKDNVMLYRHDAPDLEIVKRMWGYANFAQNTFRKSKIYPSDGELCKQTDPSYGYINPITKKADYAPIVFEKQVIDLQKRQPRRWRPGAIFCICVNYNRFFVQGFDRQGKPFISSDSNRYFVIECKDGINLTKVDHLRFKNEVPLKKDKTLTQVFVCETEDIENSIILLRRLIQLSLWAFVGIAWLWWYICRKSALAGKFRPLNLGAVILSMLLVIAFYACAFGFF